MAKAPASKKRRVKKRTKKALPGTLTGSTMNGFPVMRVVARKLEGAGYNPREIDKKALRGLKASVDEFGMPQPIIWNKRTHRLVGGHQRLRTIDPDSETDVVVVDLDEAREKALNVALNSPEIQGSWTDGINALLDEIKVEVPDLASDLLFDDLLQGITDSFNSGEENDQGFSENYTRKIESPVYEPHGDEPELEELYDRTKTDQLVSEIEKAKKVPRDVKEFLVNAATRHTKFRFDRIAEYYAHAPADVQDLMERSALVVIDFEKAIELGYVKLNETMLAQAGVVKADLEAEGA